ncbi:MAG: phosphodiester glycosidase family protein [Acaryochloris sp. RU_4_1]|nr:phosphodiester glycosidase family protein [Acaryochloris sp. RU_4_1]NJR53684.1 phosphodiester glycosidase family protein [Acaryochloris sp. CRU_2_0]
MRVILLPLSLSLIFGLGLCTAPSQLAPQSRTPTSPPHEVVYRNYNLPKAVVHLVKIPQHPHYLMYPLVADGLMTVDKFAQQDQPPPGDGEQSPSSRPTTIAVLNAGYFDPMNQQTTSYIQINGKVQADPQQNARLMENPDLQTYLPKILNRSEFRQYQCGKTLQYAITPHQDPLPPSCQLRYALGAGPQLLPELTLQAEGFTDTVNGQVIRDAIGSSQPNARSAIALTQNGDILWVMVEQQSSAQPGLSLPALANFLKQQGAKTALNLDGGSSSALVYQGKVYAGQTDPSGQSRVRPVKSVLILQEKASQ